MAQILPYKTELRDSDGVNATLWILPLADATGQPLPASTWFPANGGTPADWAALEGALGPDFAGEITDEATLLSALATHCNQQTPAPEFDIEILEDADGNPYSATFDPVTGEITGAVGFDGTIVPPADLADLQEIQNREVIKHPPIKWCVDGVAHVSCKIDIFADDQADGTPLFTETIWTLANDATGAAIADPTPGATEVVRGECPTAHRCPVDLCCGGC